MHILTISERQELIDMYTGKESSWLSIESRPAYIFEKALHYLVVKNKKTVDKARKFIDELADWTHNPTESELRKILDIEKRVSGYGFTPNADEAIAVVSYCVTHGIPCNIGIVGEFYKIEFKDITVSQCDAIVKAGNMNTITRG